MLETAKMPDNVVSVKTITKREMTRNPAVLNTIAPGETAQIEGRDGGLLVTRPKTNPMNAAQVLAEIDRVGAGLPTVNADSVLKDDE